MNVAESCDLHTDVNYPASLVALERCVYPNVILVNYVQIPVVVYCLSGYYLRKSSCLLHAFTLIVSHIQTRKRPIAIEDVTPAYTLV